MAEGIVTTEVPRIRDVAFLRVYPGMETMAEGLFKAVKRADQKALVLLGYASGTTPTVLDPLIREFTKQGIPVFVLSNNPGNTKETRNPRGIQSIKYKQQEDSVAAGVIPLKDVNVNDTEEVLLGIQTEIDSGKLGEELSKAVITKFGTPILTK